MSDTKLRCGKLIAGACAALLLTCMVGAALPAEQLKSSFKVLGPIPSRIEDTDIFLLHADDNYDPTQLKGGNCLKSRSLVYDGLKSWQHSLHARLGEDKRHAIKNAEAEKAATKDPKRKKQIGEWETRLSVAVEKMNKQIDDEYEAAIKKVHFRIPCSGK